jgi:hypothetical protein
MAGKLPPTPMGVPPGHSFWNDWYEKLRSLVNDSIVSFSDLDFSGSNLTSIATRNHNDLQNIQGGVAGQYNHLTNAELAALSAIPTLASGTYTPTLTNVTNVAASANSAAQYLRVGSMVTVSGAVTIDPTAAGSTILDISVPVASNFASVGQLAGTANAPAVNENAGIFANITDDRARLQFTAVATGNSVWYFHFTYRII